MNTHERRPVGRSVIKMGQIGTMGVGPSGAYENSFDFGIVPVDAGVMFGPFGAFVVFVCAM